ncbi:ATP-binding protein [Nostoc sp. LEGE 12447]|uniref:AAA family ATPase n=1 Tax=Nostoc sp. LEGE 12447 TaxID=1828640 RepID=UPI00188317C7|nr:AAA family ATPase [Nostoc sp. LEGE 12447]MBE9002738.1 ATP-binding protein [Nostoc sp. LEGE 12447]
MARTTQASPFFPGKPVPPKHFVGRSMEIAAAFDQINNRSHMAIWGGPGLGKSSFLELLTSPQVWKEHGLESDLSQAVIVLLSCESINPFTSSGFWQEVLSCLKDELESEPALQTEIQSFLDKGQTTKESLRQILRKLGKKHNKFLVLLVDDYHIALIPNQQYSEPDMEVFLSECRNLAVHSQERQYLSMIVTSLKRLSELGMKLNPNASPWYNHYLFQPLKPFSDQEVDQLIIKVLNIDIQAAQTFKPVILAIAAGHPGLLQIVGSLLFRKLRTGELPNEEAIIKEVESTTKQIFQNIWDRCSEQEQTLLMLLALFNLKGRLHKKVKFDLSGIDLIFTQKERDFSNLEEQGIVVSVEKEGKRVYSLASSIMQQWIIQEIWNTDNDLLHKRQHVFINLMSREQVEKVTNAINWLWKHKDEVPSNVEWIVKVIAALPSGLIL